MADDFPAQEAEAIEALQEAAAALYNLYRNRGDHAVAAASYVRDTVEDALTAEREDG